MEKDEKLDLAFKAAVYGVGAYALYKVAQKFGIFNTKEENDLENATTATTESATTTTTNNPFLAFNPNYAAEIVRAYNKKFAPKVFDGTYNMYGLSQAQFLGLATKIFKATTLADDNEDAVYDVFRSIQTQWQLSVLSSVFHTFYKKDLYNYIAAPNGFLNAAEMAPILAMVKNYPQYRKK